MKTLREIQLEQHEGHFGPRGSDDALDGLITGFGDLHCTVYRRRQGRGTPKEHDANERDALGGMVLFLLALLSSKEKEYWSFGDSACDLTRRGDGPPITLRRNMLETIHWIADEVALGTAGDCEPDVATLMALLKDYAEAHGWDLLEIVNETWVKVSK